MANHHRGLIKLTLVALTLAIFFGATACYALNLKDAFKEGEDKPLGAAASVGAGFNTQTTFEDITGTIITTALSLMGVLFLGLAIYGGYTWMTARGNEEMVEKAKNTIINALIGLVIVLAAYAISYFVLSTVGTKVFKPEVEQLSGPKE